MTHAYDSGRLSPTQPAAGDPKNGVERVKPVKGNTMTASPVPVNLGICETGTCGCGGSGKQWMANGGVKKGSSW